MLNRWQAALAAGDADAWLAGFELLGVGPHRAPEDVDPDVMRQTRRMARQTIAKHTADERDWLVPVADTWTRAASITVPCSRSTVTSTHPTTSPWPSGWRAS